MNSAARRPIIVRLISEYFSKALSRFYHGDFAVVTLPDVVEGSKGLKEKKKGENHGSFAAYAKF